MAKNDEHLMVVMPEYDDGGGGGGGDEATLENQFLSR
jgi:hypothetical protein